MTMQQNLKGERSKQKWHRNRKLQCFPLYSNASLSFRILKIFTFNTVKQIRMITDFSQLHDNVAQLGFAGFPTRTRVARLQRTHVSHQRLFVQITLHLTETRVQQSFYFWQLFKKSKIDERIEQMQLVKFVNRENKFKAVSHLVWVCLKAMIQEKTIKEE